jgi:nitroreductase/Pyruvate/2-oxoacid:ferredoxin oxidoreductase delta subunit
MVEVKASTMLMMMLYVYGMFFMAGDIMTTLCTMCGLCQKDCSLQANAISINKTGVHIELSLCNHCGHCVSICPNDAMIHPLVSAKDIISKCFTPEEALCFLRTPRSIRQYLPTQVGNDTIEKLLNAGRYPQTPKNTQGIEYIVVTGKNKIKQIHDLYSKLVSSLDKNDQLYPLLTRPLLKENKNGEDYLFYNCPHLILAISDKYSLTAMRNAQFSLTFISLMAPSLGLGTCWCGQLEHLVHHANFMEDFIKILKIPKNKAIFGCMMFGYPSIRFRKLVERDKLRIYWR